MAIFVDIIPMAMQYSIMYDWHLKEWIEIREKKKLY